MADRKTTIFKQLILNVVIPAILAVLVLGVINFFRTRSILQQSAESQGRIISRATSASSRSARWVLVFRATSKDPTCAVLACPATTTPTGSAATFPCASG